MHHAGRRQPPTTTHLDKFAGVMKTMSSSWISLMKYSPGPTCRSNVNCMHSPCIFASAAGMKESRSCDASHQNGAKSKISLGSLGQAHELRREGGRFGKHTFEGERVERGKVVRLLVAHQLRMDFKLQPSGWRRFVRNRLVLYPCLPRPRALI